jgi:hypothetical protein
VKAGHARRPRRDPLPLPEAHWHFLELRGAGDYHDYTTFRTTPAVDCFKLDFVGVDFGRTNTGISICTLFNDLPPSCGACLSLAIKCLILSRVVQCTAPRTAPDLDLRSSQLTTPYISKVPHGVSGELWRLFCFESCSSKLHKSGTALQIL